MLDLEDIKRRMNGALETLRHEFGGLRTGRASAALLDPVMVTAYGQTVPLTQIGNISVPEPRLLSVQIWDKDQVLAADKAIREAGLGLNPMTEGQTIRIPIPELNEERRIEIVKIAAKYAEQARIAIRNVRRDGMEQAKRAEKDKKIGKDKAHDLGIDVQKITDKMIAEIDTALTKKEGEIRQV